MRYCLPLGKLLCLLLLGFAPALVKAADWPEFRGPGGQGHSDATGLPIEWSATKNIAWRTEIPGKGWSSPVIAGDQIWLTYAIDEPITEEEKQKKLAANTGNQPLQVVGAVHMHAVCVDRQSGKLLHDVELMVERDPQWTHALNSFASPTPVIADGKLYCHFGAHGTACLDTKSLKVLWTNNETRVMHENGPGSSPVLVGERLIFHCDGSDEQYIAALDTATGKIAWKTERSGEMNSNPQLKKAYGTPIVMELHGRTTVLSPAADWLYAYDPQTGKELWKAPYGVLGFSIVPRPVAGHGMVYLSTSFMQSEMLAVRVDDTSSHPSIAWRNKKGVPKMSSPLLVGDELYMVSDNGIATCLDAKTGDALWSERLGGNVSSSPIYADGRIYIGNREGETFVLAPGRQFKLLATNALDEAIMATPAAVDGALILRTEKALYRIAEPPAQ
jgi:outer membrane protein assembly factor BamB